MNWTKEQQDAIYKKDSNILVAAAAGSGKIYRAGGKADSIWLG